MTIESATYLNDLNSALPAGSDAKSEGNDHIALIKAVLKATFPGLAGRAWRKQSKSGSYTVAVTDNMSWINFSATATANLPPAAAAGNGFCILIRAGSGVTVTIDADGTELVNNVATATIDNLDVALLFCDGSTWAMLWVQNGASTSLTDPTLLRPVLGAARENISVANVNGAQAIDMSPQAYFAFTLTGNVTFSFSNVPSTGTAIAVTLELIQGGSGSYTVTWPGSVLWASNVAPVLTTTVGKKDFITLMTRDGGTTWHGFVAGQNY